VVFIYSLFISCEKTDEFRPNSLQTPIITGYVLTDMVGNFIGVVGEPNTRRYCTDAFGSWYVLSCLPNPVTVGLGIIIEAPTDSVLKQVWLTPAIYFGESSNFQSYDPTLILIGGYPILKYETYGNNIIIPVIKQGEDDTGYFDERILPDGFYRVYVRLGSILLWDNILILRN